MKRFFLDLFKKAPYLRYREKEDRPRRLMGQALCLAAVFLGQDYLVWHYRYLNWTTWYVSVPFFWAECLSLTSFGFFTLISWYPRFHDPQGLLLDKPFSVDIFITTCGEPLDIVRKTLVATAAINYPWRTVYVLDDAANPRVQTLAQGLGFIYLNRPERLNAKGGNLNFGLAHSQGDLVLTLDADQIPQPDILTRLVGYFKIPKIAFVQSKQKFLVPRGDPFGNTDKIFYNVMQCGKDTDNAAFSCGSGVVYRRQALKEIGGFSTWNLVEDLHTSMLLHQRGWRSIYYNYPLTVGTAPADIWGVYRQRRQWAVDSLRLLFWDNPFRRRGLTLIQKLQYFHIGFVYLISAWVMPIFFLVPVWSLFTFEPVLTATVPLYVVRRLPYFILTVVGYCLLTFPTPYFFPYQMWTGLFPVFQQATFLALRHRQSNPPYRVTKKRNRSLEGPPILAIIPQLALISAGVAAVVYGAVFRGGPLDFRLLNCAWAIWAIYVLSGICRAALSGAHLEKKFAEPCGITSRQKINIVLELVIFLSIVLFLAVVITNLSLQGTYLGLGPPR